MDNPRQPFMPTWPRPDRREIRAVHRALRQQYGPRLWRAQHDTVLDALVATILSQNTSDANSHRAFASLKARFPQWEQVRRAAVEEVEETIRSGGLARTKAERIQRLLQEVHEEQGETSLEHLREAPAEEVKTALARFRGVGPKTIACVLLFTLGRPDFPVDTHVHRVSLRLGWVPPGTSAEATYAHLNPRVPDELKYELHMLLVAHGRRLCRSQRPRCAACPLRQRCDQGKAASGG